MRRQDGYLNDLEGSCICFDRGDGRPPLWLAGGTTPDVR